MIISHKHRFIFIKPFKCAGSSIQVALASICGPDDIVTIVDPPPGVEGVDYEFTPRNCKDVDEHLPPAQIAERWPEEWRTYRRVTATRNPWEVTASMFALHVYRFKTVTDDPRNLMQFCTENRNRKFYFDQHGRYIAGASIRFEHLNADFRVVCLSYGFKPPPLPHMKRNRTSEDRRRAMSYFGPAEIEAVRQNWTLEIDRWAYSWENARK